MAIDIGNEILCGLVTASTWHNMYTYCTDKYQASIVGNREIMTLKSNPKNGGVQT